MDPVTLATTITTLISPLLAKVGDSVIDKVASAMPEKVGKLWDAISERFRGNPAAEIAANDLIKNADEKDNQEIFELQLRKALKENPDFANLLSKLLQEAEASLKNRGNNTAVFAQDHGIAVGNIDIGGDAPGNIVIGNENQIGDSNQHMEVSDS